MSDRPVVDKAAEALIVWMDTFAQINQHTKFPPSPSTAPWGAYNSVEQATARLAAQAVLAVIEKTKEEAS